MLPFGGSLYRARPPFYWQHMNRRFALALLLLLAAPTAHAQYQGATVPNCGPIATSVTTRVHNATLPAIVWATADATATGLDHPFTDPDYAFDLGTPGDTFAHPVSGEWTDSRWQSGPLAVGVYRTPGTFDVSLTTRVWDGVTLQTAQAVSTVTIVDPQTRTVYFDSAAAAGGDGTQALPWNTVPKLQSTIKGAQALRVRLACGSVFVMATPLAIGSNERGLVIESYGTGSPPILRAGGGSCCVWVKVDGPNMHATDVVFSGIDFDAGGKQIAMQVYQASGGSVNGLGFLTCRFYGCAVGAKPMKIQAMDTNRISDVCFWNSVLDGGTAAMQNLFLSQRGTGFAMLMTKVTGGNPLANEVLDHHLYLKGVDDLLLRWVSFDKAGRFNYCLNGACSSVAAQPLPGPITTRRWLIADCDIKGTRNGIDLGENNNLSTRGRFDDVLIQGNAIHNCGINGGAPPSQGQSFAVFYATAEHVTIRDNCFFRNQTTTAATAVIRCDDTYADLRIYRNQFFVPAVASPTAGIIQFKGGGDLTGSLVTGNLFDDRRVGPPNPVTNAAGVVVSGNTAGAATSAIGSLAR